MQGIERIRAHQYFWAWDSCTSFVDWLKQQQQWLCFGQRPYYSVECKSSVLNNAYSYLNIQLQLLWGSCQGVPLQGTMHATQHLPFCKGRIFVWCRDLQAHSIHPGCDTTSPHPFQLRFVLKHNTNCTPLPFSIFSGFRFPRTNPSLSSSLGSLCLESGTSLWPGMR